MKKSRKVTIVSIIVIAIIAVLLQTYDYCLNLSVELPKEIDEAVTECIETMVFPDEYQATFKPLRYDFTTSAYHAFGYTEDDTYIKVYGYCALLEFSNETLKENKERKEKHINMYSDDFGEVDYFVAYLKKDGEDKVTPDKIWVSQYPQTLTDILKKMPIRTWLYIFLDDPSNGDSQKLITECVDKMYEYIDSHDIPESNEKK